jgi:hypothetical protein
MTSCCTCPAGEKHSALGSVSKWADKWGKEGANVWHEKWGEWLNASSNSGDAVGVRVS